MERRPSTNKNFNKKPSNKKFNKTNTNVRKKNPHTVVMPTEIVRGGYLEYKMPEAMYNTLLKEGGYPGNPQAYLCDIVNRQYGMMGACLRVIPF